MKPKHRLKALYERLLPTFPIELLRLTRDCHRILDVGCGSDSRVGRLPNTIHKVGVDGFGQSLELSRQRGLHHEYRQMDVLEIGKAFGEGSFDCVLACDVIEHLEKADGLKLMAMMERIARKKVIIKTPNGFLRQGEYEDNPLQIHRSGWEVAEMRQRGYRVIGVGGWKGLKGERAELKFKS